MNGHFTAKDIEIANKKAISKTHFTVLLLRNND